MDDQTFDLTGRRIVVVQDDFQLASDLCRELRSLGATVLGPAPTPFYAMQLIGQRDHRKVHAAVLDVHLHGTTAYELADTLQERGIPMIFATAHDRRNIPARFNGAPVLQKPVSSGKLIQEIVGLLNRARPSLPQLAAPLPRPPLSNEPPVMHFARALARSMASNASR